MNETEMRVDEIAQRRANRTGRAYFVVRDRRSGVTCPFEVDGWFDMSREVRDDFAFVSLHNPEVAS
jgi:hypothetical protein